MIVVGRILVLPMVVGIVLAVDEAANGAVTAGTIGSTALGPTVPTMGDVVGVGTAGVALTPRLPISVDPIGIPARATPPDVVGDVDVGADDEAVLLEPEPHIPDNPDVSSIPEVVEVPDVAAIPDDVDMPDVAVVPDIAPVAAVAVPVAIPPPSNVAVDPNIPVGEVPTVEHVVPLFVLGIVIVPVTPVGDGLTPGDASSVAPIGIPVGETDPPTAPFPSGEVALSEGVVGTVPT